MGNTDILENLHLLVSNNVIGPGQCLSRYKGFRSELLFLKEVKIDANILKGGYIISLTDRNSSLNNSIYFTILSEAHSINDYTEIYQKLTRLNFKRLFIIFYRGNLIYKPVMFFEKEKIELPVPDFYIYEFCKEKSAFSFLTHQIEVITNCFIKHKIRHSSSEPIGAEVQDWLHTHLKDFDPELLMDLYVNRLVFDGFLGFSVKKGKPSDIDLVTFRDGRYHFIEIKEKDLPKKARRGFGLDVPRLDDFRRIEKQTGIPYYLCVRHINDQNTRELISWKCISIEDFYEDVKDKCFVEGGHGMRSEDSDNPTRICSLSRFRDLTPAQ